LADEARAKEVSGNIKKLATKRLDFQPREVYKRSNSFKGSTEGLLNPGEQEEWKKIFSDLRKERAPSRRMNRDKVNRQILVLDYNAQGKFDDST